MIRAEHERREDGWDYTRHIMAAMGAGNPRSIIKLRRDTPEITDEVIDRAKQMLAKMSKLPN